MTGGLRQRPVLAEAGHAAEDELRVDLQKLFGSEPETLHDAGSEALDQGVGLGRELLDDGAPRLGLDVEGE